MYKTITTMMLTFSLCVMLINTSYSAVLFENNFDSLQTWNPTGSDACWQNTVMIDGGSNSCKNKSPGPAPSVFNDYRLLTPQCSSIAPMHVGGAADIAALKSTAGFTPYNNVGKSYVHFYEPCMSSSGGWGSDGLLGVYLGKSAGNSELYVQAKVRFDPNWVWQNGSQLKLMHIAHFDENYNQGVLQAYEFFNYNLPDMVPGIYVNTLYYPEPQFYLHSSHADVGKTTASVVTTPPSHINISDGNWHTVKYHVKLNTAANLANGVKEMWLDGQLVASYTDVPWTGANTPTAAAYGFNRVIFGGNSSNIFGTADGRTQWYALDELVISTTDISTNYVIGGVSAAPAQVKNPLGTKL